MIANADVVDPAAIEQRHIAHRVGGMLVRHISHSASILTRCLLLCTRGRCMALLGKHGLRASWLRCMVVEDSAENRTLLGHLRGVSEAGFRMRVRIVSPELSRT